MLIKERLDHYWRAKALFIQKYNHISYEQNETEI